jgi:hypothetical protein
MRERQERTIGMLVVLRAENVIDREPTPACFVARLLVEGIARALSTSVEFAPGRTARTGHGQGPGRHRLPCGRPELAASDDSAVTPFVKARNGSSSSAKRRCLPPLHAARGSRMDQS